jgi:hypothetical protein
MMRKFYVLNEAGLPSFADDNADEAESFKSLEQAQQRAVELANECPGECYELVGTVGFMRCPVGEADYTVVGA